MKKPEIITEIDKNTKKYYSLRADAISHIEGMIESVTHTEKIIEPLRTDKNVFEKEFQELSENKERLKSIVKELNKA